MKKLFKSIVVVLISSGIFAQAKKGAVPLNENLYGKFQERIK
jgi:hypothetical protein